jgi:putative SOS response-associated peptidase YedK
MCGRFVGLRPLHELMDNFPIDVSKADTSENFNVGPSQEAFAIARYEEQNHLVKFNWDLVPFLAKEKSIGNRMSNARSAAATTTPRFRSAFGKRGNKGKEETPYRS